MLVQIFCQDAKEFTAATVIFALYPIYAEGPKDLASLTTNNLLIKLCQFGFSILALSQY